MNVHHLIALMTALSLLALAAQPEAVRNDRVAVTDVTLKPGETQTWSGGLPSVIVFFTGGALETASGTAKAKRGDSIFQPSQAASIRNTGLSELHFARIEMLGSGSAETWGAAGLSPRYKLLFENRHTRVYDIRIKAGEHEPQHTHKDRVVVCLSGAKLSHLLPDGRDEPSTLKTGEIAWRRGGTHIGRNLGTTDLWVIAVEPK